MAVLPMKKISVIGLNKNRKAILEALQRNGTVDVTDTSTESFQKLETDEAQGEFARAIKQADTALEILNRELPPDSAIPVSFKGRTKLSAKLYYDYIAEKDEIMRVANHVEELDRICSEQNAEIVKLHARIAALDPWLLLDVPINTTGTKHTAAFVGMFPKGLTEAQLLSDYAAHIPAELSDDESLAISAEIISVDAVQTCTFIVGLKKSADRIESILRSCGFQHVSLPDSGIPRESQRALYEKIEACNTAISDARSEIKSCAGMRNALRFISDYYSMRIDKYRILSEITMTRTSFLIEGYVPEKDAEEVETILTHKYNAFVELGDIAEDEQPPVLLKNGFFAEGVEPVLESYSLPNKHEIDPSPILAVFYYALFGLMLADVAYGLIMVLGCGFVLLKFKDMEKSLSKSLKMFFWCGVSTAIWGFVFGSLFGDVVGVTSTAFFGGDSEFAPLWFSPNVEPMKMLMFSLALGIVHIFTGLGISAYQKVKMHDYVSAVFDVGSWFLLVGGLIVALCTTSLFTDMSGIVLNLPASTANVSLIVAAVGAAGIVFFAGRSSKSPVKRFLKGLYELYNVTSYLSDILSYSRLLALGLATGVIASVFNQMGTMAGNGPLGIILFIVSFCAGHALNFGINLLGAYVHTNRLQYVEFFSKFYEGGGEKYTPFSENTKHYIIKEDITNG